jgi:hypothetical protein
VLSVAILLPTTSMVNNALGQSEEVTEENNIKLARQVIEAFNTGDVSNVSQFISPQYFNHESQVDPVRGQLRGPEEFIDLLKIYDLSFLILDMKNRQSLHKVIWLFL